MSGCQGIRMSGCQGVKVAQLEEPWVVNHWVAAVPNLTKDYSKSFNSSFNFSYNSSFNSSKLAFIKLLMLLLGVLNL